ncbi:MAG: SLOG cluster 4 domain-containing protein [Minisyncoccota bacterium]
MTPTSTEISGIDNSKHEHLRYKICISGAAETSHCGPEAMDLAKELGREIIRQGGIIVTGATTGFPLWAAMGAKEMGGLSIGLSPASTEREHVEVYGLPLDYLDVIIYTGFGYSGRNLLLTRSSDAILVGCGRVGTINEFTIAFEDGKPIGVLEGSWPTDEVIRGIMEKGHRTSDLVVFDPSPKRLVEKAITLIRKNREHHEFVYQNHDGVGGSTGEVVL